MIRQPVASSNLISVGYDAANCTLEIEFRSGKVYSYADVSPEAYKALVDASSVGKYFDAMIRGKYAYKAVGAEKP
jgi:hypothetical protein